MKNDGSNNFIYFKYTLLSIINVNNEKLRQI